MKTPAPIAVSNFAKKQPKRQAHIHIPSQYETPRGSPYPMVFILGLDLDKLPNVGFKAFVNTVAG